MKAEIIVIGTELLLGQIVDTNASYLARQLAALGIDVYRKTTVGDNEQRIADVIRSALGRCDAVITSGGIGPTVDDKTREGIARATNQNLILNADLLEYITKFFRRRGLDLGENNKRQAYIPETAVPIENPVGTAPGFILDHEGACIISLPGVPRELYYLTEHTLLPFLRRKFGIRTALKIRLLRTAGIGESNIDRMIDDLETSLNPTVGLSAHPGSVDIRISAKAESEETATHMLNKMEADIRSRVGDIIYGVDTDTVEQVVVGILQKRNLTLSLVETNTGGFFVSRLTEVPEGFSVLSCAEILSMRQTTEHPTLEIRDDRVPSAELSERMASQIRNHAKTDIGMAIIGEADPDLGPYKDVTGNTYIGLSSEDSTASLHVQIGGVSSDARIRITSFAFEALRKYLLRQHACN
jgi:nicotinamide-nucleotide amidase